MQSEKDDGANCGDIWHSLRLVHADARLADWRARYVARRKAKQVKHTPGRVRILKAMAQPGAYARPDRSVVGLPPQIYRIKPDMVEMFTRAGFIAEAKPPKQERPLLYVHVITDAGREWLRQAPNV